MYKVIVLLLLLITSCKTAPIQTVQSGLQLVEVQEEIQQKDKTDYTILTEDQVYEQVVAYAEADFDYILVGTGKAQYELQWNLYKQSGVIKFKGKTTVDYWAYIIVFISGLLIGFSIPIILSRKSKFIDLTGLWKQSSK